MTTEILSLWRSPLDKVALVQAEALQERQPRCTISYGEDFSAMTIYNYGHYLPLGTTPDTGLGNMFIAMIGTGTNPILRQGVHPAKELRGTRDIDRLYRPRPVRNRRLRRRRNAGSDRRHCVLPFRH